MAARGIASWGECLATKWVMTTTSTLRFWPRRALPHSSGIHGLEFFFVTSQALSCSAIYFAEGCGKSVTVRIKGKGGEIFLDAG